MIISNRVLAIGMSLGLMFIIIEFVRSKKLKEKHALLWLFAGLVILILAVFNNVLDWITRALGITLSVNTIFFFGIFFILVLNLSFSLIMSGLTDQNKKMAQKIALLEAEMRILKKK